jgi:hypothetical protein
MKQLQKNDLKLGKIYWFIGKTVNFLSKISNNNINVHDCYLYNTIFYPNKGENLRDPVSILEATPEEKHWLETCIKAYKFVSYDEAMKTFVPEYYEYIGETNSYNTEFIKGRIYKIVNKNNLEVPFNFINEKGKANGWSGTNYKRFTPSTKEAYDAQFVVKEPEFVLPEKWAIIITNENKDIVNKYRKSIFNNNNISCNLDVDNVHLSDRYDGTYYHYNKHYFKKHTNCEEITLEQFKQYVLKENTTSTVTEKPKVVLEESKYDILISKEGKYIGVQCPEGGVYKIGDKITVFDKTSPNKGKVFTIKRFRWNNTKTKICAVTELHTPNGIGLDKIELYVEPKVKSEIVDDFVLPEKWCVKINEEIRNKFGYYEACGYHHSIQINDTNKWSIYIREGFTEITLEQFKKYVLNEKV